MSIPRFIILTALATAPLIALAFWMTQQWIPQYSPYAMSTAILVSFFTGLIAYILLYINLDKASRLFVTSLAVGTVSKMFIGIVVVLFVAIQYKPVIKEYVVAYFLSYFILTAFEVYGLMTKLRA